MRAGSAEISPRFLALDIRLCLFLNRAHRRRLLLACFRLVSRLGDGPAWYLWLVAMPLLFGADALAVVAQLAVGNAVGVALYRRLKRWRRRPRPYFSIREIVRVASPLDPYSFPSGHTLHAVLFATVSVASFPAAGWVLVPFATLTALSRVVLGLHYPSDVLAGGLLGGGLGAALVLLWP